MEQKLATGLEGVTVSYEGLGQLLHKQASTLKSDMSRKPQDLPPPALIGVKGRPIWIVSDVLNWLRARTLQEGQKRRLSPALQASMLKAREHTRGASTKRERIEAARLGITVRELRRRHADAAVAPAGKAGQ